MKFCNDFAQHVNLTSQAISIWNPEVGHCADGTASVLAMTLWRAHSRFGARIGGGRGVLFWCRRVLAGATHRMHVLHALHALAPAPGRRGLFFAMEACGLRVQFSAANLVANKKAFESRKTKM